MCKGINKNGKPCGRKVEWCPQHISQKPYETFKKNVKPELIETEEEFVSKDIEPPMSPNATPISASKLELLILEAGKSEQVKNNSIQGSYLPIEVFDVKDAADTHMIVDTIWIYKQYFRLAQENGSPICYYNKGELSSLFQAGKSCVEYPFFNCSEDEFNAMKDAGEKPIPKDMLRLVFDSDAERDSTFAVIDEMSMSPVDLILKLKTTMNIYTIYASSSVPTGLRIMITCGTSPA